MNAANPDRTPAEWAVRFVASLEGVIMVLSGMSNMDQLDENTRFMSDFTPLSEEENAMLFACAEQINKSIAVNCTGCSYCTTDCPKQIPIPAWFDLYNKEGKKTEKTVAFAADHPLPSDCIKCGKCEKQCPQKLPIRRLLRAATDALEL